MEILLASIGWGRIAVLFDEYFMERARRAAGYGEGPAARSGRLHGGAVWWLCCSSSALASGKAAAHAGAARATRRSICGVDGTALSPTQPEPPSTALRSRLLKFLEERCGIPRRCWSPNGAGRREAGAVGGGAAVYLEQAEGRTPRPRLASIRGPAGARRDQARLATRIRRQVSLQEDWRN